MKVVRAGLEHVETLAPLFDAYRVFYKRDSDLEAARAYMQARLERDEATVFLALGEAGEALGFALCYSTFSSVVMKPLVILNDLYTVPEARGQGIGAALIEQCSAFARDQGALVLRLRTAIDNHTAQALYERVGFKRDTVYLTYDLAL
jgi:ribosomal protein S18 acetylase RimI-like enzyme